MTLTFAAVVLGLSGCKSSWSIKNPLPPMSNPFSSKPTPGIESPAEMDNIKLKAPPENYTQKSYHQENTSPDSLAQNGSYRAHGTSANQNTAADSASAGKSPVEVAMNPNAPGNSNNVPSNLPSNVPNSSFSYTGDGAAANNFASGQMPRQAASDTAAQTAPYQPLPIGTPATVSPASTGSLPNASATNSPYETAPAAGYSVPGFNTNPSSTVYGSEPSATPSAAPAAPFTPGSIGGY